MNVTGDLMHEILQPEGWAKPVGYSNGIAARGRIVDGDDQHAVDDNAGHGLGKFQAHCVNPLPAGRRP